MAKPDSVEHSRRGILAAGAGAFAALAAQALGRPRAVSATDNEALVIGQTRTGTLPTALVVTQPQSPFIYGFAVTEALNSFPSSGTIAAHAKTAHAAAVLGYGEGDTADVHVLNATPGDYANRP